MSPGLALPGPSLRPAGPPPERPGPSSRVGPAGGLVSRRPGLAGNPDGAARTSAVPPGRCSRSTRPAGYDRWSTRLLVMSPVAGMRDRDAGQIRRPEASRPDAALRLPAREGWRLQELGRAEGGP